MTDLKEHEKKAYLMSYVDNPLEVMPNECTSLIEGVKVNIYGYILIIMEVK